MPSSLSSLSSHVSDTTPNSLQVSNQKQSQIAQSIQKIMDRSYTVQKNDTVADIARAIGVSPDRLNASLLLGASTLVGRVINYASGVVEIVSSDGTHNTTIPMSANDDSFRQAA